MRPALLLFILFLVFSTTSPCFAEEITGTAEAEETAVTVLIYHRIGEDKYPTTNIAVERLREQLE